MTLPFFQKTGVKKKKPVTNESISSPSSSSTYPTLSSLIQKTNANETTIIDPLEPEEIDENFFYKHMMTHFHSLFCESAIVCIPHSKSIEGLVITKDIIGKIYNFICMKRYTYFIYVCLIFPFLIPVNPSRNALFSTLPLLLWAIHGN